MNNKALLIVLSMIISLAIGILASAIYFRGKMKQSGSECISKKTESATAAIDFAQIVVPNQRFAISGKVEKIDGKALVVKTLAFSGGEKNYSVNIVDGTKISKREFQINSSNLEQGKNPVSFSADAEASFSDIRTGDTIIIEASENIKDKTEFEAKSVAIIIASADSPK